MLVEIMKAVVVKFVADLIQKHAAQLWHPCRSISLWRYRDQLDELRCLLQEDGVPAYGDNAVIDEEVQSIGVELNHRGGFAAMRFVAQHAQEQLCPLGGRLAGDYLDKMWNGIGDWVS